METLVYDHYHRLKRQYNTYYSDVRFGDIRIVVKGCEANHFQEDYYKMQREWIASTTEEELRAPAEVVVLFTAALPTSIREREQT